MPKKAWKIEQFHGGLNTNADNRDIAIDELASSTDVMVDEVGKLRAMGGPEDYSSTIETAGLWGKRTPGYGLFQFSHDWSGGSDTSEVASKVADNYLITSGATQADSIAANLDIYSENENEWGNSVIQMGLCEEGENPSLCFYYVDGELRISDGNYKNTGVNNKWYGYVPKKLFPNSSSPIGSTGWQHTNQEIGKPNIGSFSTTVTTSGAEIDNNYFYGVDSSDDLPGDLATDSLYRANTGLSSYLENNNIIKIEVYIRELTDGYGLWSGTYTADLKIGTSNSGDFDGGYSDTFEISGSAGVGMYSSSIMSEYVFDFNTTAFDLSANASSDGIRIELSNEVYEGGITDLQIVGVRIYDGTSTGSSHDNDDILFEIQGEERSEASGWGNNARNVGMSLQYRDGSEGPINILSNGTSTALAVMGDSDDTTEGTFKSPKIKFNLKNDVSLDPRVTGVNLYFKEIDTDDNDWYKHVFYDCENGVAKISGSSDELSINYDAQLNEFQNEISSSIMITPIRGYPYNISSGLYKDEESIFSRYKTAVVTNRRVYVANLRVSYLESGKQPKIMGDAMIKSPVNNFDIFPLSNMVEASVNDGDEIIKLEEYADRILQFKKNKMHLINVSQELEFLEDTFMYKGISHPAAACKTDFGVAWVNVNGCYLYDGRQVTNLLERKNLQIINDRQWSDDFYTENAMIGYLPKKRQLIVLKSSANIDSGGLSDIYLYDMVTKSWTFGRKYRKYHDSSNFIVDWNNELINIYNFNEIFKWDDEGSTSTHLEVVTKDIDFGQPAQRKKFYKAYITYKCTGDSNIRAKYAVNGTSTWYDFKQENLGRSVLSINGMPSTSVSGEANTYSVSPTGGNGHGLQLSIRVIFDPAEQEYLIDESDILNSGDGYVVGDIVTIPANALGAGSSSFTLTVASVDTTTDWQVDTLVPDVSSEANNIYSLKLKFEADGTVPADFEINDMSIIYRVKALK